MREVLHGEHAGCYDYGHGNHFLTDGGHKYVWYSQSGREQLFDLDADPQEERDLALLADGEGRLAPWRARLAEVLRDRPEGFVEDGRLVAGRPHRNLIPGYDPGETYDFL